MGATLLAILTAALLLPGIVAVRAFYQASDTNEVDPSIPALATTNGIALTGLFSVLVHLVYVVLLVVLDRYRASLTSLIGDLGLPLADPYRLFTAPLAGVDSTAALPFFLGLFWLCALAVVIGFAGGRLLMLTGDLTIFYGALADVIEQGTGDNTFITAYVLTKLRHDRRVVGYQGTVVSLIRDEERFPAKIMLKDASIFYLDFDGDAPVRQEHAGLIDWLALSAGEWENVAFRVFAVEEDQSGPDVPRRRSLLALAGIVSLLSLPFRRSG